MKKTIYLLFILFTLYFCIDTVFASSGALRKNSIKTCPNGVTYGYHGNDKHWHVAERSNVSSGWSAVGEPLSGDPCPNGGGNSYQNTTRKITTPPPTTTTTTVPPTTTTAITTEPTTIPPTTIPTENNSVIKKVLVNNDDIGKINKEMSYIINSKSITINVILSDPLSSYEIEGNTNDFELDEERTFLIKVNEANGEYEEYLLKIKREQGYLYSKLDFLKINGSSISLDSSYIEHSLFAWENNITFEYELNDSNVKVNFYRGNEKLSSIKNINYDDNNNSFIIELIDDNDNVKKYYIHIYKLSLIGSLFVMLFTALVFALPVYLIYKIIKKIRNNSNIKHFKNDDKEIVNNDKSKAIKISGKGKFFPKVGFRIPNITKRIRANTTGKFTRKVKNSINPLYGVKGIGFLKKPKRSIKNKIYHKTTFGIKKFFK